MVLVSLVLSHLAVAGIGGNYQLTTSGNPQCGDASTVMVISQSGTTLAVEGTYIRPRSDSSDPHFRLGVNRVDAAMGCLDPAQPRPAPVPGRLQPGFVPQRPCQNPASFITIESASLSAGGELSYTQSWGQNCVPGGDLNTCNGTGENYYTYTPTSQGLDMKVWSQGSNSVIQCSFRGPSL